MSDTLVTIPDLGGEGEIIEISVKIGDVIEAESTVMTVESDKASMEVPAPFSGTVTAILVKVGDAASEGAPMLKLQTASAVEPEETPKADTQRADQPTESAPLNTTSVTTLTVPDLGGSGHIIELLVSPGDNIAIDDSLMTVESDKATIEVPAPEAGKIVAWHVKIGDEVQQGTPWFDLEVTGQAATATPSPVKDTKTAQKPTTATHTASAFHEVYAGPAVRKMAREQGIDLTQISGSGRKQRILKEDVTAFSQKATDTTQSSTGNTESSPFGANTHEPLTRLQKVAINNFHNSWTTIPHVTQFDEADITEMEAFRKSMKAEAQNRGSKLTPLPIMIKAVACVLQQLPKFCASLDLQKDHIVYKHYTHIGVAVDTPNGLLVPVIKDVDKKGIWQIADECTELANKAKNKQLKPIEMQGGCFTISSLGSIGGTAFTPIVNSPEVAILGVSKAEIQPKWNGQEFVPRLMLPLCLSYDHRVINGADAARFTQLLSQLLTDLRKMLL